MIHPDTNLALALSSFDPDLAHKVSDWSHDPVYSRFFRWSNRYLTVQECQRLPEYLGCEVLVIEHGISILGIMTAREEIRGVIKFGLLVEEKFQRKGIGFEAVNLLSDYCRDKKGSRMLITDIADSDAHLHRSLVDLNFTCAGTIPEHCFDRGVYEATSIYYRKVG